MATGKVSKHLQQGRSGGEGPGNRGDFSAGAMSQEKCHNCTPVLFLIDDFLGRRPDSVVINDVLQIACFQVLEFRWSTEIP